MCIYIYILCVCVREYVYICMCMRARECACTHVYIMRESPQTPTNAIRGVLGYLTPNNPSIWKKCYLDSSQPESGWYGLVVTLFGN